MYTIRELLNYCSKNNVEISIKPVQYMSQIVFEVKTSRDDIHAREIVDINYSRASFSDMFEYLLNYNLSKIQAFEAEREFKEKEAKKYLSKLHEDRL